MSTFGIKISPSGISTARGRLNLNYPIAHNGGGLFAITAGWCGHCTRLHTSVTEAMKIKPFTFFYLDATDNNDPEVQKKLSEIKVTSFPTLYYIDKGGYLLPYNGDRSPNVLAKKFK